jgi:predicted nuclease with TOPRIM domain
MRDKKTILCAILIVGLFISNGAWVFHNQQLQDNEQEMQAEIDLLSSENSILRTQNSDLYNQAISLNNQNLLLGSQLAAMQESLNESLDNYSELNQQYVDLFADFDNIQIQYNILNEQFNNSQDNYSLLTLQYTQLQSNFSELFTQYEITQNQYDELLAQYSTLFAQYDALTNEYNLLSHDYDSLEFSYRAVLDELMFLDIVHIDSLVHDYYQTIRDEKSPWLEIDSEMATFYSKFSKHDQGTIWWPDIGTDYYDITGSHRYSEARVTLMNLIALAGVDSSDTGPEKIGKILSFVNSKIEYQYDLHDRGFFPTETLSSGTGDCEDYSILFSALFELSGIESAIGLFENDAGTSGHAMVLVYLPDLGGYGHYYYSDLTSYGLRSGKWIIIEPQYDSLQDQCNSNWILKWNIKAAAET